MKQTSRNYVDENFANILNFANLEKFPKICDYCGEIFEVDLNKSCEKYKFVRCISCYSLYEVIYNNLNNFYYLEFIKSGVEDSFLDIATY